MTEPFNADELRARIAASPYHRSNEARLERLDRGHVEMRITVLERHLNPQGIVHGGVIAGLLDSVCGISLRTILSRETSHRTVQLNVTYMRAVREGTLLGIGRAIKEGRSLGHAEGEVRDEAGELVARGTGVFFNLPAGP